MLFAIFLKSKFFVASTEFQKWRSIFVIQLRLGLVYFALKLFLVVCCNRLKGWTWKSSPKNVMVSAPWWTALFDILITLIRRNILFMGKGTAFTHKTAINPRVKTP